MNKLTWIYTLIGLKLAEMLGVDGGIFGGDSTIMLYTARGVPLGLNLTASDLTEATFGGYAQMNVSPDVVSRETYGWQSGGTPVTWNPTDALTPENIMGAALLDGDGNVIAAGDFDAPIPMLSPDDYLNMTPTASLAFGTDGGPCIAV